MNIAYKNIIWDWNGTLLDDAFACIYAMNILLREHGLPEMDEKRYMQVFGFPVKDYYELLGFDFSEVVWDDLANHFISIYKDKTLEADLHSGTVETFEFINDSNVDMHILSASESQMLDDMIKKHKLDGLVKSVTGLDNIYASSKIDVGKSMLESLGCDPSLCLMVGDTIHDVEVAEALGIDCVLVEGGYQSRERLSSTGKPVFKNIKEVLTYISQ
ncbi:MAG: HAD family hydrolase [Kiritimatiellae bacterium]|jgi:phosphoglycolate phosphatase|nr:HAD family hydrolase [Kiritimatiellia bacterium]